MCCGCIPIIGVIKGLILVIPVAICICLGSFGVCLYKLPKAVYYTYYYIYKAKKLGINLKLLITPLIPIVALLWLLFAFVVTLVGGILYGFFSPMYYTWHEDYNLFTGGFKSIYENVLSWVFGLSELHEEYFEKCKYPNTSYSKTYDFNIFLAILVLPFGIIGFFVSGIGITLVVCI